MRRIMAFVPPPWRQRMRGSGVLSVGKVEEGMVFVVGVLGAVDGAVKGGEVS